MGSNKASLYRVPVAVEAYKKGRAAKILLSGGSIREFPEGKMLEADHMYKAAVSMGVNPEEERTVKCQYKNQTKIRKMFGIKV